MSGANDDSSLVARCKRELPHQHGAFEELIQRYKNKVYTLCYRMIGNASDAEDLMQEIFMRVFVALQSFEERAKFSTWLYRVTYNHCLNFLAKQRQYGGRDEAYAEQAAGQSPTSSPEVSAGLEEALLRLEKEPRTLLIMKYIMDLEVREIAATLGISQSAVKMRLLRAREELRALYLGER